jgi:hypothetical protein
MTTSYLPSPLERTWIERAAAHCQPEDRLTPEARFRDGITDLDVTRVMLAIERGAVITQSVTGRWYAPSGTHVDQQSLSRVVNEMIRTGLAVHHLSGVLIPTLVHMDSWDEGMQWRVSACGVAGEGMGPKRVRLHASPGLVDCLACLDRL